MKKIFIALFIFLSIISFGQTQNGENRIVVVGEATIEIPADQIIFNIKLTFKDSTKIEKAYESHKIAEKKLLDYLEELKIPQKNINYSLININKQYDYILNKNVQVFTTFQNINVKIEDLKQSTDFMLKLISAGFNEITQTFKSSKENSFEDILIEKAIKSAKSKAEIMAKASNRKLSRVLTVLETDESVENFRLGKQFRGAVSVGYGNQLTEIPQTVTKSIFLKVVFRLQ